MEIKCTFGDFKSSHGEIYYGCFVKNKQIPENEAFKLIGKHDKKRTNFSVIYVKFEDCTVTRVPQGLTDMFPNMKSLSIQNSKLKELKRCDMTEYRKMEGFTCILNEVEVLPVDLFSDFENLFWIVFWKNKLNFIDPFILNNLKKLKYVDFRDNPNYDMAYSVYSVYNPTHSSLNDVIKELLNKMPIRLSLPLNNESNLQAVNQNVAVDVPKISEENLNEEIHQHNTLEDKLTPNLQKGIFADIKTFIQDETNKDFRIQIDDRDFPVHKFLLAARSPTLAEILRNNPEVENLNLVDISVEIFEKILKFLYTDELPRENGTNFLHLFAAAGKLKIAELKDFAAKKLVNQINEETAFDVFKVSYIYDHEELRLKSFEMIKEKYPEIKFRDEWMLDFEKLSKVIEAYLKKKEAMRRIEDEFQQVMMTD